MRIVAMMPSSTDGKTWRIVLSCGHETSFVSTSKVASRGRPRRTIEPCYACLAARRALAWTGPRDEDFAADGCSLRAPVPPERWPYGPPSRHEDCCRLRAGGLYCDCRASAADDDAHGEFA